MQTIRKEMLLMLDNTPLGARELSQALHISEKEVYDHLVHIERSARASGRKLVIEPAQCLGCDFVFKERRRFSPPGHCPVCKGSHIRRPVFSIS